MFLSETEKIHFLGGLVCLVAEDSALEEAKYRAWGHEYVITSLLENAVILETIKKERGASVGGHLRPTLIQATRHVCLGGALARPCTILVAKSPAPELHCCASHQHGSG